MCVCACVCVLVQDKQKSVLKRTIQQLSDTLLDFSAKLIDTVLDSPSTMWTELPEYVFEAVVDNLQTDRKASAIFRQVCHAG